MIMSNFMDIEKYCKYILLNKQVANLIFFDKLFITNSMIINLLDCNYSDIVY